MSIIKIFLNIQKDYVLSLEFFIYLQNNIFENYSVSTCNIINVKNVKALQ